MGALMEKKIFIVVSHATDRLSGLDVNYYDSLEDAASDIAEGMYLNPSKVDPRALIVTAYSVSLSHLKVVSTEKMTDALLLAIAAEYAAIVEREKPVGERHE